MSDIESTVLNELYIFKIKWFTLKDGLKNCYNYLTEIFLYLSKKLAISI